jgi:hypothetical protein
MENPFDYDPTHLSPAEVVQLIAAKRFAPLPCSPFGILQAPDQPVTGTGATLSPEAEQALAILAAPDARIRLSSWRRGDRPAQVVLFRRGDQAAPGGLDQENLFIGRPIAISALVDYLVGQLASRPPSPERRDLLISPKMLVGISWLWSYGQRSATDRVRAKDLEKRLTESRVEEPQALLAELVEAGVLETIGATLRLGGEWVPWLSRIWSSESAEVELSLLPQDRVPTPDELETTQERMLFVGARGERLLARLVPSDDGGTPPAPGEEAKPEDLQLAYSHLADDELREFLTGMLTQSEARDSEPAKRSL